ncbi:hypothetical protein P8452_24650 [Trifolium repens]|nr:hypothetical protein P8452_24650 [Trifolium repens]
MDTRKISALTMIFFLAFFIFASDMCMKIDGKKPCKYDGECECKIGFPRCDNGECWCFLPPPTDSNIHNVISQKN